MPRRARERLGRRRRHRLRRAEAAREQLPPYERRRVEFFELPKTISGKIRRVELRQREADAATAGERLPDEWRDDQFPELKGRG